MEENKKQLAISMKSILIIVIAIILIIAIIAIVNSNKKENNGEEGNNNATVLTEGDYQKIVIKDLEVKYNKDEGETTVSFILQNKTDKKIEDKAIDAILQNDQGQQIGGIRIELEKAIEKNEEYKVSEILSGDGSTITKIQLQKVVEEEAPLENEGEEISEDTTEE